MVGFHTEQTAKGAFLQLYCCAEACQEAALLSVKIDGDGVVGDSVGIGALRPGSGVDGDEHDVRILVFCFICSLLEGESRHDEHVVAGVDKIGDGLENSRGGVFRGLQIADLNAVIGGSLLQTFPCGLDKGLVVDGGRAANQTDFQRGGIHGGIRGGVFAGVFCGVGRVGRRARLGSFTGSCVLRLAGAARCQA